MKNTALRWLVWVGVLPFVLSCNHFKPFSAPGDDETYREEAKYCLHNSDYTCAVDAYNHLSDPDERDQQLCLVEMAQSGMTLTALVNVVSEKTTGQQLFGALANQLIPYSSDKGAAATDAKTKCAALTTSGPRGKLNELLQVLSLMVDCSLRMARTQQTQCTAIRDGGQVAGPGHSTVSKTDISPDGTGALISGQPGMCDTDANACGSDIYTAVQQIPSLQNTGFGDIAQNLSQLSVGSPPATADLARVLIQQTTTN